MKFKCKVCNGTGLIPNTDFEICRSAEFREWAGIKEGDCEHCPEHFRNLCKKGEQIVCYNCNGNGYMEIDENLWEIDTFLDENEKMMTLVLGKINNYLLKLEKKGLTGEDKYKYGLAKILKESLENG